MISVMILSAGLGTRMRPLSDWRAKPLAPVGDKPALAHVLGAVRSHAAVVVINAHHRAEDIRAFARAQTEGPALAVSEEVELLGTAGGVHHAAALLDRGRPPGPVLVWNGDILAEIDVGALVAAHATEATLVVRPGPRASGNVGMTADGRVVRLRAETTAPGEERGGEFLGIHILGEGLRRTLPERGCLVGDVYLPALRRGARLDVFTTQVDFWDIGTVATYLAANLVWLTRRGLRELVAPGARIDAGVTLEGAIVHAGAHVTGSGVVCDAVIWEGATCAAPFERGVVAREGMARSSA